MTGRLALVTGTSSGLGLAVAQQLLERGWEVVGVARRGAPLRQPAYRHLELDLGDLPRLVSVIQAELAPRLESTAWDRLGLVNNAASMGPLEPLPRLESATTLHDVYAVNLTAPVWLMSFFARHCRQAVLRIVNVSSGAARQPRPGLMAYNTSKAGLRSASQTLAAEWANAVSHAPAPADASILSYEPNVVDTPMQQAARSLLEDQFPWVASFQQHYRSGTLVPPAAPAREIADFLESGEQPYLVERRYQP